MDIEKYFRPLSGIPNETGTDDEDDDYDHTPLQPLALLGPSSRSSSASFGMDKPDARMSMPPIFDAIQNDDNSGLRLLVTENPDAVNNTAHAGMQPIHAATHAFNLRALDLLLENGAQVDRCDTLGYTALHLASSEGWHQGMALLVRHGANVNAMLNPTGMVKGIRQETPLHIAIRRGDIQAVGILLETADLSLKDGDHNTVLHLAAMSKNATLLRTFLPQKECLPLLNMGEVAGNSVLHSVLQGECEEEDFEERMVECLSLLLDRGADPNSVNLMGETPLVLAARSKRPVALALLLRRGADATIVARDGTTVLHAACRFGSAKCLRQLVQLPSVKSLVKAEDNSDQTPFHLAVKSYSVECCHLLLNHGDHLARRDHKGETMYSLALRFLPGAYDLFERVFDSHLTLSGNDTLAPHFSVTFDFSCLIPPESENDVQSSLVGELATSAERDLLKHPLVETFLYIKWRKIKPFFYCNVWIYLLFLILHTAYIVMTFGNKPVSWTEKDVFLVLMKVLHILMFILILVPNIVVFFLNWKKCMRQWETLCKMLVLCTSSYIVFCDNSHEGKVLRTHIAAISGFFGWVEFMILLGRFPSLGVYILMFSRVAKSLLKFILAFSSLLVAFALCFFVLMKSLPDFRTFPLSFSKTLIMMIGEIEYGNIVSQVDHEYKTMTIIVLILFLFLVAILMANLLIGLAVNDIPELQRQGKIHRLAKEVSYLVSYERLLMITSEVACFPDYLRLLVGSRCKIPSRINNEPNRRKKRHMRRMPHYVPSDALREAVKRGSASLSTEKKAEAPVLQLLRRMDSKRTRDHQTMEQKIEALQKANEKHICNSVSREIQSLRKELQKQALLLQQLLNTKT
ncbi:transient receptor potential cation channel subfamily A member 1-like isoform X2 [Oratosquilla oratoria]|uniref:transient receptor potential cation channel subfamily A member 1-like isoform X2 n=1 Tax=Oratosquilla oratoria TaxID=337810 RepID=UPI003F7773BD